MAVDTSPGASRGGALIGGPVFSAILKEYYRPGVRDLLNNKTVLSRILQRKTDSIEGKYAVLDLNVGRNFGHGAAGEGGLLPDPLLQDVRQARFHVRYTYGRIKFTGPSASGSRSDRGSFIRVVDLEMQGLTRDMQVTDNRILFGDGSGRLCQISGGGAGAGASYQTSNPGGTVSTALGDQYLEPGMRVGFKSIGVSADTPASTVLSTGPGAVFTGGFCAAYIATADRSTGNITFSSTWPNITPTTAGVITVGPQFLYTVNEVATTTSASPESWARGREPFGLAAIVNDVDPVFCDGASGNWPLGLGEIPAATTLQWRANILDNGGTAIPFVPDMLQTGMDMTGDNGDGVVNIWITRNGIRRQYLNLMVGSRRFNGNAAIEMDGGFKALSYDGRPIVTDRHCTAGRVYGLDLESIYLAYENDYDWMDKDGAVLQRIPNRDAYEACLFRYWQLCTDARNRNLAILDIQDT